MGRLLTIATMVQNKKFHQQRAVLLQLHTLARAHLVVDFKNIHANLEGLRDPQTTLCQSLY